MWLINWKIHLHSKPSGVLGKELVAEWVGKEVSVMIVMLNVLQCSGLSLLKESWIEF